MSRMYLLGKVPPLGVGGEYVTQPPYDGAMIGSLTIGQLLRFQDEQVFSLLAEGKPVYLYTPGLPEAAKNRSLAASLASAQRELKNWGVIFTDGGRKRLITAEEAKALRQSGQKPERGAVLTPLAKEILEGSD